MKSLKESHQMKDKSLSGRKTPYLSKVSQKISGVKNEKSQIISTTTPIIRSSKDGTEELINYVNSSGSGPTINKMQKDVIRRGMTIERDFSNVSQPPAYINTKKSTQHHNNYINFTNIPLSSSSYKNVIGGTKKTFSGLNVTEPTSKLGSLASRRITERANVAKGALEYRTNLRLSKSTLNTRDRIKNQPFKSTLSSVTNITDQLLDDSDLDFASRLYPVDLERPKTRRFHPEKNILLEQGKRVLRKTQRVSAPISVSSSKFNSTDLILDKFKMAKVSKSTPFSPPPTTDKPKFFNHFNKTNSNAILTNFTSQKGQLIIGSDSREGMTEKPIKVSLSALIRNNNDRNLEEPQKTKSVTEVPSLENISGTKEEPTSPPEVVSSTTLLRHEAITNLLKEIEQDEIKSEVLAKPLKSPSVSSSKVLNSPSTTSARRASRNMKCGDCTGKESTKVNKLPLTKKKVMAKGRSASKGSQLIDFYATQNVFIDDQLKTCLERQEILEGQVQEFIAKIKSKTASKSCSEETLENLETLVKLQTDVINIQIDLKKRYDVSLHPSAVLKKSASQQDTCTAQTSSSAPILNGFNLPYGQLAACAREIDRKIAFYCPTCVVACDNEMKFRLHIEGESHLARAYKELKSTQPLYNCDDCNTEIQGTTQYLAHLHAGQNHIRNRKTNSSSNALSLLKNRVSDHVIRTTELK